MAQAEFWPERIRVLPNDLARCALFTAAGKKEPRVQHKRSLLASLHGMEITYNGEELRQDDQDVWLQLVHIARTQAVGEHIEVTLHALIRALGWGRSSENYTRVRASMMRMTEATVWLTRQQKNPWSGRLIAEVKVRGEDLAPDGISAGAWTITLDPKIISLFGAPDVTRIEWEQRLTLKPLAKWLHSFYASHREPYPYRVATLHQLCGSKTARLSHFRSSLKDSLEELVAAAFLAAWEHDARQDTITVVRRLQPALIAP